MAGHGTAGRRAAGAAPSEAEVLRVLRALDGHVGYGGDPGVTEEQITWLRWENEHPTAVYLPPGLPPYAVWNLKQNLLRDLCRASVLAPFEGELVELLLGVVHRRHEEYDRYYSRLALRLDGPRLRAGLTAALDAQEAGTGVRAAWLLDVLDHPDVPPTHARWRAWTAAHGLPHRLDRSAHDEDERDRLHARRRAAMRA
ncbi:hypothetical protein AAG589_17375 [Isoptericola sp. F-RaC21]|uniref:hypothetical protein n=1 Tax=Isoptericola sp. F-RaC21 TaxID=3141452 RepID=UPI00315C48A5